MNAPVQPAILTYQAETEFFTAELCHINELSNSAADEELSVAVARVEPGVTTCWHRLRDTTERYVILSGQALVEVGDLAPRPLKVWDSVVIPAGCRQRITNTGSVDLVFLALCTPRFRPEVYEALEPIP